MSGNLVNGAYFERVELLFNNNIEINSANTMKVTTSGDQQVSAVNGMSANHLVPGFTRGNAQYIANVTTFQTYNQASIDFVNIDYDIIVVTLALYAPSSNFGSNNVFANSQKYYLLTQIFLASNDEVQSTGVGQPVTSDYIFKVVNAQWVFNAN